MSARRLLPRLWWMAAALWCLYLVPRPSFLLQDDDYGLVMYGGRAIFELREWPFVDFFSNYGPATYAAMGAFLALGRGAFVGVAVFAAAMHLVTLFCIIKEAQAVTGSARFAIVVAVLAAPFAVRPFFFWISLLPVVFLMLVRSRPADGPLCARLGVLCATAFLFRHDFGAYLAIASLPTLVAACGRRWFALGATLPLLPWLAFLAARGALSTYFDQLLYASLDEPIFNTFAHPLAFGRGPAVAIVYAFFYGAVAAGYAVLVMRRKERSEPWWRDLLTTTVLANLALLYSLNCSGYWHFAGSVWPALMLLPKVYARAGRARPFVSAAALSAAVAGFAIFPAGDFSIHIADKMEGMIGNPLQLALGNADEPTAAAVGVVARCTKSGAPVLGLPALSGLPFYTGRRLAGRHLMIENGFYRAPKYQAATVARFERLPPELVVDFPGALRPPYWFDWARNERFDVIRDHIERRMAMVGRHQGLVFYARPDVQAEMRSCLDRFFSAAPS